jgi:uncharacterized membrane protein
MLDIFNTIRPILSGLVGTFFIYLMIRFTKPEAKKIGNRKILEYSRGFKILTLTLAPFSIFVVYAASHARESQIIIAGIVAFCFVAGAVFFVYQVFFVHFSYDKKCIYYQSPLKGTVKAPWNSLLSVSYSSLLQADYLVVDGIGKIWCSNMLNGYNELGEFLEDKVKELYPE